MGKARCDRGKRRNGVCMKRKRCMYNRHEDWDETKQESEIPEVRLFFFASPSSGEREREIRREREKNQYSKMDV